MKTIPLYIIEEHHEAFLIWNHAIATRILRRSHNTLVHIDEHADMGTSNLRLSIPAVGSDLACLSAFTYDQLNIGSFIVPCAFMRIFDRIFWVRQSQDGANCETKRMWVRSSSREGKLFLEEEESGESHPVPEEAGKDRVNFSHTTMSVTEPFPRARSVVLDIDLDYFSSEGIPRRAIRIEVTEREYRSFLKDRYHPLRLFSSADPEVEDSRYYFVLNWANGNVHPAKKVSEAVILERISELTEFLKKNEIRPRLIDICRSRISGHTPEEQWSFIEKSLLEKLSTVFEVEGFHIEDILRNGDRFRRNPQRRELRTSGGDAKKEGRTAGMGKTRIRIKDL